MTEREARFRALFDASYRPLHAYARRRTTPSDADDIVAEVLTVAWRRLEDIPPGATLPWLYGVAHRTLANHRRSAVRRLRLADRLEAERAGSEPPDLAPVLEAVARLGPNDQEILRLAAWEQLRPAEIGVVLGCTANAASLRLSRARQRLRGELTETAGRRTPAPRKVTDA